MLVSGGEALQPDPVRDRRRLVLGHAQIDQTPAHTFRHADQSRADLAQPTRLRALEARVSLARVVLHLHQHRHASQTPGATAQQVFGKAMGHQDIGVKLLAEATQRPDRRQVRPAGHDIHRQALLAQRLDAGQLDGVLGAHLAAQDQDGRDALALQLRQAQIDRHLRGAGEPAGHEVQHAAARGRRRSARGNLRHRASVCGARSVTGAPRPPAAARARVRPRPRSHGKFGLIRGDHQAPAITIAGNGEP